MDNSLDWESGDFTAALRIDWWGVGDAGNIEGEG